MLDLGKIRDEIDATDDEIVRLVPAPDGADGGGCAVQDRDRKSRF